MNFFICKDDIFLMLYDIFDVKSNFVFFRVFRELKMMRFFKHENVLSCLDILQVQILGKCAPSSDTVSKVQTFILEILIIAREKNCKNCEWTVSLEFFYFFYLLYFFRGMPTAVTNSVLLLSKGFYYSELRAGCQNLRHDTL